MIPDITIPDITIPEIKIPDITVPDVFVEAPAITLQSRQNQRASQCISYLRRQAFQ